jgi:NodT family efflux transporter outer membrane factor (OMF) lipoprotein
MPAEPRRLNTTDHHRRPPVLLLGVLLSVLAGCAEPLPRLAPPLPAQWQHAQAAAAAAPVDLHGWWHAFHDPALDALVERALTDNLDVAQAAEHLRAARSLRRRAGARYLPGLVARTGDAIDPDASASFFVAGFDATWELGLFGRAEGTRRVAQGELDASVADLHAARVSLVAEVVREWIGLRTAQQQEQLLQQVAAERRHAWQLLLTRQRLHLASPEAVDQAEAACAQAQAALAAPRQAIDAGAQRLAVLLGRNRPDSAWLQAGPPPELGAWRIDGTPAELLRTRPEIARAEADVLRSAGELALAHADMFPSIGLGASMLWATDINNNHRFSTTPNDIVSVGPVINIPLFDWGMRVAARQARGHELQASVLAYRQAVLQGVAEVETALGSLQQQRQREQHDQAAWQALQRADQAVHRRVELQLDSPLGQSESRIAAIQAGLELADARASHGLAYVTLFKALGGAPLPPAQDGAADAAPVPR